MEPLGLYIHIPFCRQKCLYCDFFSGRGSELEYDRYVKETIKKMHYWAQLCDKKVTSVYFGGGTPSVMGAVRLCKLLSEAKSAFEISDNAEITCELNPESGKSINFEMLREYGFNRLSVGLQSSNEAELKALGRIHTAGEARLTAQNAFKAGFDNISFDLMLGIPYQTEQSLGESIRFCADCGVTHISSYLLKIEEGTPFYSIKEKLSLPDEDEEAKIYLMTVDELERLGYMQYEISNFAKPGFEGRHNINYWKCGEYIGIGPSAHSFFDGKRFYYGRSMTDYYGRKIIDDGTGGDSGEYFMLALRLRDGVVFEEYKKRYGVSLDDDTLQKLKRFAAHGFMELDDRHACFTKKGFLVSNSIISELI